MASLPQILYVHAKLFQSAQEGCDQDVERVTFFGYCQGKQRMYIKIQDRLALFMAQYKC